MAQKQPESNPNHSSSSSEEEEEEEEEATGSEDSQSESQEVSDSDSGQNKQTPDKKTSISQTPSKPTKNLQNPDENLSESEEESGSDTDSDDSPPKTAGAGKVVPAKPISVKRPAAAPEKPEVKKAKKDGSGDDECKKQLFQRLWSEDDEIVILKGMIDYKKENGESPVNDMGAFHEFIKKSLHVDVSRAQLVDKVRRLKKKYVNNVGKEKNGKDRSFSKSHEQKGYELSKNNGGSVAKASGSNSVVKLNGGVDGKGDGVLVKGGMDVNRFVWYGSNEGPVLVEEVVKGGMELVQGSKLKELEEKWKELKRQELLLCVKRMDLFKEQALVVIDAVNSSEN